jgi:GPR endopeptidase
MFYDVGGQIMSLIRTDLALEAHESAARSGKPDGVVVEKFSRGGINVSRVKVIDERGEQAIGKPVGTYVTVETGKLDNVGGDEYNEAVEAVADEIKEILKKAGNGLVLVAGLGNAGMTPDALGPRCVKNILVTRHIAGELTKIEGLESLRAVAAIAPGVLGQTGVETGEIIKAIVERIHPAAVIAVDALASRRTSRLGNTIQIADTGINPGSGIGNMRFAINQETLGVPVISIGVPTVVDAATLAIDVLEGAGIETPPKDEERIRASIDPDGVSLFVTPRMIDLIVEHAASLAALAINRALHPGVSVEDINKLVS